MGRLVRVVLLAMVAVTGVRAQSARSEDAQAPRPEPPRPYRGGVELVTLNVTVTDGEQRYVTNLAPQDFVVIEDGRPQPVSFFAHSGVPLTVALVIDSSGSMDDALAASQDAAIAFVRRLGAADRAAIVDFDTRVRVAQSFTADARALEDAVRSTVADGSTALYDAVHVALQELGALTYADAETPPRHAIVLLSDGQDTSSHVDLDTILALADRSNTAIYTVGLGARDDAGRLATYQAEFALRRLANQTGGRAFFPTGMGQLRGVYDEIRRDLASQYTLAYASTNPRRDGRWRTVTVRLSQRDLDAHTRPGYFAARR